MVYDEGCVYCRTDYQILSNKDEITTTGVLPFVEISIPLRDGCCLYAVKSHHQCNQAGSPMWP